MKYICFFGDGVTQGLGDPTQAGWPGRLCTMERAQDRPLTGFNLGVTSNCSEDIAARWYHEAEPRIGSAEQAGLVFSFGLYDMADVDHDGIRLPLMEALAAAESLIAGAARHWPVLWIGPAPVRSGAPPVIQDGHWRRFSTARVEGLSGAYRLAAQRMGIPYLDLCVVLRDSAEWQRAGGDGVHPDGPGHQAIAAAVRRWSAWRRWMDEPLPRRLPLPGPTRGQMGR